MADEKWRVGLGNQLKAGSSEVPSGKSGSGRRGRRVRERESFRGAISLAVVASVLAIGGVEGISVQAQTVVDIPTGVHNGGYAVPSSGTLNGQYIVNSVGNTFAVGAGSSSTASVDALKVFLGPASGNPSGGGSVTLNVIDSVFTNNRINGASLGINLSVNTVPGSGTLNLSGDNVIMVGNASLGLIGNGGGTLVNTKGTGNATTIVAGTLTLSAITARTTGTGGSPGKNDGMETTARSGVATLDMSGLTGPSTVYADGGNGLLVDSLYQPSVPAGSTGGNVVIVGISSYLTITVDNTYFGSAARPITGLASPIANAGILATSFGVGNVDVQGTAATIVTTGPLADGIHAIAQAGTVNVTNFGNITTDGLASHGIEASTTNTAYDPTLFAEVVPAMPRTNTGAVTVINSGVIATSGTGAAGPSVAGSPVTLTDPSNGIYAWTYSADTATAGDVTVHNLVGGDITTSGDYSSAIMAASTSVAGKAGAITITNDAALITTGNDANGITAIANGTTGAGPMSITNTGWINSHSGSGVFAAATTAPVGGTGATLSLTNDGSIAGYIGITISNNFLSAQIDNTGILAASSDLAVDSHTLATGPMTINNAGTIEGYVTLGDGINTMTNSGQWYLRNFNNATGTLGVAVADFGYSGDNTLTNTGTITLLGPPLTVTTVDTTGQYLPLSTGSVANAQVNNPNNAMAAAGPMQGQILGVQTFTNSGTIDLTNSAVAGNVLIISGGHTAGTDGGGVFVADGGSLKLNTVLNDGGPNAKSDMLVVDSTRLGSAPTAIVVNNAGGLGVKTVGDGIALVEVLNKNASADGVFALGSRVAAGAYDYGLFHNGVGADAADGNWYLRSTKIRPEVPTDVVAPALASRMGRGMLGTYFSRIGNYYMGSNNYASSDANGCGGGAATQSCTQPDTQPGTQPDTQPYQCQDSAVQYANLLWGRVFGETGRGGGGGGSGNFGFGKNGPAYSFDYGGSQVGMDFFRGEKDTLGLYVGASTLRSNVNEATGKFAGRLSIDAFALGGYWTHRELSGWYTDLVLQGDWYQSIRARSSNQQDFTTSGLGLTASAETGYLIDLSKVGEDKNDESWKGLSLIPQAQLLYQYTNLCDGSDPYGQIHYGSTSELYGRLGSRFSKVWTNGMTAWAEANLWHQFGGRAKTTFTTPNNLDPTTVSSSMGGTWAQAILGISVPLTKNVCIFSTADYNIGLDQPGHSFGGQLGIQVGW
ncbi:MAG: autotransporter domain-containing protein [Phycisphaerales bacterium]|nr:autotransporter domain-containing protein [Phycisphaerales bacterium]